MPYQFLQNLISRFVNICNCGSPHIHPSDLVPGNPVYFIELNFVRIKLLTSRSAGFKCVLNLTRKRILTPFNNLYVGSILGEIRHGHNGLLYKKDENRKTDLREREWGSEPPIRRIF